MYTVSVICEQLEITKSESHIIYWFPLQVQVTQTLVMRLKSSLSSWTKKEINRCDSVHTLSPLFLLPFFPVATIACESGASDSLGHICYSVTQNWHSRD